MVPTGEGDETGARDAGGQLAAGLEGNHEIVPHMHDKRRRLHLGQKFSDIVEPGRRYTQFSAVGIIKLF